MLKVLISSYTKNEFGLNLDDIHLPCLVEHRSGVIGLITSRVNNEKANILILTSNGAFTHGDNYVSLLNEWKIWNGNITLENTKR